MKKTLITLFILIVLNILLLSVSICYAQNDIKARAEFEEVIDGLRGSGLGVRLKASCGDRKACC